MGALSPIFLLASVAVGVPLFLHLFHRQQARRISFPALRYLARTEREHARQIRFRQLLLLLLRVAVVLAVVGAGAGLFLYGRGGEHPPTALAIVLDNSMSSGVVTGDERALDRLKGLADRTLSLANEGDRIWVLRAGEPWLAALPSGVSEARAVVAETSVSASGGDLSGAIERAADLVRTSGMEHTEIHVLSDLQATAFRREVERAAGEVPVVVWGASEEAPANRALTGLLVGGGLAPLMGQRSDVTVQSLTGTPGDTTPAPVRIVLDDRVRGAGTLPPGAAVSLPLPPTQSGWTQGYVDQDPDALSADDRRYFVIHARPAPAVSVAGDVGVFATEALSVLESVGRLSVSDIDAGTIVSASGAGMESARAGSAVLILPPSDPTLLPSLNRRLAERGIPWRADRRIPSGEAELEGLELPEPLVGARVRAWYDLTQEGEATGATRTLARVAGDPWMVEGATPDGGRFLLLASALDGTSTSLPVSAEMVRFVDWVVGQWAQSGGGPTERLAGDPLPAPHDADQVRLPDGQVSPVDGTRMVRGTSSAGFYTFLAGDSVLTVEAVNPPAAESNLTPIAPDELERRVGDEVTVVDREGAWERAIFRTRQGPRLRHSLLLLVIALLVAEAAVAASGRRSASVAEAGGRG